MATAQKPGTEHHTVDLLEGTLTHPFFQSDPLCQKLQNIRKVKKNIDTYKRNSVNHLW